MLTTEEISEIETEAAHYPKRERNSVPACLGFRPRERE